MLIDSGVNALSPGRSDSRNLWYSASCMHRVSQYVSRGLVSQFIVHYDKPSRYEQLISLERLQIIYCITTSWPSWLIRKYCYIGGALCILSLRANCTNGCIEYQKFYRYQKNLIFRHDHPGTYYHYRSNFQLHSKRYLWQQRCELESGQRI